MSRGIEKKAAREMRRESRRVGPVIVESINRQPLSWRVVFAFKVLGGHVKAADLGSMRDPNAPRVKTVMLPHKLR